MKISVDSEGKSEAEIVVEYNKKLEKRSEEKMEQARAELLLRVDDGQLSHMRSPDPLVIWQELRRVHLAAGFATSLALRRKFLTSKKGDVPMVGWIGQIQSLAFRMEEAGVSVSEQDRILALTMGLPSTYDAVIINFDSTPADQLTLEHVITRLLNEETRQGSSSQPSSQEEEAMAVASGRRPRASAAALADVTCFFCDGKGHYKSDCPEKKKWEKTRGGVAATVEEDSDDDDVAFSAEEF